MDPFGAAPVSTLDLSAGDLRPSFFARFLGEVRKINADLAKTAKRKQITLQGKIGDLTDADVVVLLPAGTSFTTIDGHCKDPARWLDDRGFGPAHVPGLMEGLMAVGPVEESADLLNLDHNELLASASMLAGGGEGVPTQVAQQLMLVCAEWKAQGAVTVPNKKPPPPKEKDVKKKKRGSGKQKTVNALIKNSGRKGSLKKANSRKSLKAQAIKEENEKRKGAAVAALKTTLTRNDAASRIQVLIQFGTPTYSF
jgi:hypothetical protein